MSTSNAPTVTTPIQPLTTKFTPAPSCLSDIHYGSPSSWFVLGQYDTACFPGDSLDPATAKPYYSPALQCPAGYTVACSSLNSLGTYTETVATCCPQLTNISLLTGTTMACFTDPPAWGAWSSYGCQAVLGSLGTQAPLTIVSTNSAGLVATTATQLTDVNEGLNAFSVQIRWQASDLTTTTSSASIPATSPSRSTSGGSSATQTSVPAGSSGSVTQNQSSGLSIGAKAAVGVVVPLVIIAIAVVALLYSRRKKRQPRQSDVLQIAGNPRHEVESNPITHGMHYNEKGIHHSSGMPQELDKNGQRYTGGLVEKES